jgi:hypothetical protein
LGKEESEKREEIEDRQSKREETNVGSDLREDLE